MKKQILFLITLAIAICGCQKEESYPSAGNQDVIGAVIASETGTKTAMNGSQVVWEEGDEISIFSKDGNYFVNNKYSLISGGSTTNATFSGYFEGESKVAALYPFSEGASYSANGVSLTLPATYTYENDHKNNKAPMAAMISSNDIVFLNAGALMTLTVRNIPAGYNAAKLYVTDANDPALAGECVVTFDGGIPTMKAAANASVKEVKIEFTPSNEVSTKTFHFPVPVGNYTTLAFAITDGTETKVLKEKALNVQRNKKYTNTITLDSVTGGIPEETTMENVEEDLKTKPNVTIDNVSSSDDATISLPTETAGQEVNINFESIDANVDEIVINSADASDAQVPTVLNITVPTLGDQTKIEVDMPNTTVTITAADTGETTVINELTASTADNTLIVESGVTIEKLYVEKGNVRVKKGAKIIAIERTQTNTDALTYVIYEEGATIPESVADNKIFLVKAEDYAGLPSIGNVHYKNLQYAVDAASKGDVIEIPAGTYKEVVKVTGGKEITLKAIEDDVVIYGLDHQSNGNPSTVKVVGVTFDNSSATGWYTGTAQNIAPCVGIWGGYISFENCKFIVAGTSGKETGVMTWWTTDLVKLAFDGCTFVGKDDNASARAMQIYGNVNMDVKNSEFTTKYRYALKYVGSENGGNVALFSNNEVYNSQNFVELGSATYPGENYEVRINNTTLGEGVNPFVVANDEGQTVNVDNKYYAWNTSALSTVLKAGQNSIYLLAGEYSMPSDAKGKSLTINGVVGQPDSVVINVVPAGQGEAGGQLDYNLDGSTVTFNNLTIKTNSQLYAGFARLSAKYNKCIIQNTYNLGTGSSAFNECTFNITNEYLRVGGANSAVFDGCTFNTDGRAILVFQDGTYVAQTVLVKDCTFNATAQAKTWNGIHVAAVSIDGTNGTYEVSLEGNNVVDSDFNGLWQIKAGETNVTVKEPSTAE